uniref:Uncharacterized protein n=1 Tax=Romanomermis culicivorax TaxID=13658 RepID=A0A915KVK2_ROMCU
MGARVYCQWNYSRHPGGQDLVGRRTVVAGSGRHLPCCGGSQSQHGAHSSCCHVTDNNEDGSPNTGGIAQQQPIANAFGEPLCAVNNVVSITEASPFPRASIRRSPKIDVLREVHPCRGLVINFPREDPVSSDDDDVEE